MGKYPIYAFVALIFIGIIKLLQVTAFNAEKYDKNKKLSFSKPLDKVETPYKKEGKGEKVVKEKSQDSPEKKQRLKPGEVESPKESESVAEEESNKIERVESDNSSFESPATAEPLVSYSGLDDLKNIYLAPKISQLPPGQLREDVVIRYYRHEQDEGKVYVLKDLGYYIHEKEATETAGLGSNVIYYGENVNTEDIQIVAYTLLGEGLPIKSIQPTQFSWKSNSLEIGTDTLLLDNQVMTESEIQNFSK